MKPVAEKRKPIDLSKIPRDNPDDILEVLQSMAGEGVIVQRGQDLEGRMDLRRPSGITTLDIACKGGIPAGGMTQIDGQDGAGKNLLMNHYFARCQKAYKDDSCIQIVCFESVYDKMFGRDCGVKVALSDYEIDVEQRKRTSLGLTPLTAKEKDVLATDQVGRFHIVRGNIAEKMLQVVADSVATFSYQIIGIDSWDAMLPSDAGEKELEDNARVANSSNVQSRWMSKVFGALNPQKICPECYARPLDFKAMGPAKYIYSCSSCSWKGKRPYMWENETTIIGIRQVRANMNKAGMHARDYKVGGAHALRHGKLIDIEVRRGESILASNKKIGKEINWEITKGKAGTHEGKKGVFKYYFDPPKIDIAEDMIGYATANNLLTRGGGSGYCFNGNPVGKREQLGAAIEKDGKLRSELRRAILNHAELGHIRYR